jgi:hypothetical protein
MKTKSLQHLKIYIYNLGSSFQAQLSFIDFFRTIFHVFCFNNFPISPSFINLNFSTPIDIFYNAEKTKPEFFVCRKTNELRGRRIRSS